jgi:hypothetical protein
LRSTLLKIARSRPTLASLGQDKTKHGRDNYEKYTLKVPKREIFDLSDFPDFFRIRSSWVGDLVVKILT